MTKQMLKAAFKGFFLILLSMWHNQQHCLMGPEKQSEASSCKGKSVLLRHVELLKPL